MNIKKITGILLILGIVLLIFWLLYRTIFSISEWPEPISKNQNVKYTIEQNDNTIVYTKYENNQSVLANITTMYIPKIITTYTLKDDIVTNVVVNYHYFRECDAKKAYNKNNEYEFFNTNRQIYKNIITENLTEFYKGKSKDDILYAIKENYGL